MITINNHQINNCQSLSSIYCLLNIVLGVLHVVVIINIIVDQSVISEGYVFSLLYSYQVRLAFFCLKEFV